MTDVRPTTAQDWPAIKRIYDAAFPDEDLLPLLSELLALPNQVISLAAVGVDDLLGQVAFTLGRVEGAAAPLALLGPLAVHPDKHRQGIGSLLVKKCLDALRTQGVAKVFVLGDPAYYGRFGFAAEPAVTTPCPIPAEWAEAWQSLALDTAATDLSGQLELPEPWLKPELWSG